MVTTLAGPGLWWGAPDPLQRAEGFSEPSGIHADAAGNIIIVDRGILTVSEGIPYYRGGATLRRISPTGVMVSIAGNKDEIGHVDGPGNVARFTSPNDVASDSAGNVYVADSNSIRRVTPEGVVSTFATLAAVDNVNVVITSIAIGADNTLYTSDTSKVVRRFAPDGSHIIVAGTPGSYGNVDGSGAAARFGYPLRIAISSAGDLYVADLAYQISSIRKITPSGMVTTVTRIADHGPGSPGTLGGKLYWPTGVVALGPDELTVSSGSAIVRIILP